MTTEEKCTSSSNSDKESSYTSKSCTSFDGTKTTTTFNEKTETGLSTDDTAPKDAPVVRRR
jgi:hypothetical protein